MKKLLSLLFLTCTLTTACSPEGEVQTAEEAPKQTIDSSIILITNAHIIDGTGNVIEQGSVVIRDGLIASVATGTQSIDNALVIDAQGKTVMPGFIEGHRHVIQSEPVQWMQDQASVRMQEFLEAGFTTVFSAIDPPQILDLRRMINEGEIEGPRLLTGAFAPLAIPTGPQGPGDAARTDISRPPARPTEPANAIPDEASIANVQAIAEAGFDYVKVVMTVTPGGPEPATLKLITDEAHRLGIKSMTHTVSVIDTLGALDSGTDLLVHTPHIGQLTEEEAQMIADAGIPMTSTLGTFVPFYDDNNQPIFRDALPYPWHTLSSAGQGPVNARLLWNAGLVYGYGTDTSFLPRDTLLHELKSLHLTFSPVDIIKIMTTNSAQVVGMEDEIGTLEVGKIADVVILDGNPLDDLYDLLKVQLVIKDGRVVVDKL